MANQYKIISADSHIDTSWLPHDMFVDAAPAKWKDQVPQVIETKQGMKWFAEGTDMSLPPTDLSIMDLSVHLEGFPEGHSEHIDRMHEAGFYDGRYHPSTPEVRLEDQALDGVDAEVIYGPLGLEKQLKSRELMQVVYSIYNDWAVKFQATHPDRFAPIGLVDSADPKQSADEVRRVAKLGLKGVEFSFNTALLPIWHRDWDELWGASAETGVNISFHARGVPVAPALNEEMNNEYKDTIMGIKLCLFQLGGAEALGSIIFSGATERFPDFKFILGEAGVAWLPYTLSRMDHEWEDRYEKMKELCPQKPSFYWRRQGYTSFQREPALHTAVDFVGEDNIMWGADYPHPDGTWPDSHKFMDMDLAGLSSEARQKITRDNVGKLFGFLNGAN